jgi:predicted nucleic acid-binding protein
MTGYVVDASVAVKWLIAETFSDQAVRLLDQKLTLIAPELLFAEAANALWMMCRRGGITKADLVEAVDVLKAAPVAVPVSMRELAASASRWRPISATRHMIVSTSRSLCKNNIPS